MVGHIEDIAVSKDQQGKKLGLRIIQALDHIAQKVGCYKVGPSICVLHCAIVFVGRNADVCVQTILDCSEANEGFYVKCGYKRVGLEMAHYH
jgi:glucosamine-phosphate N-acetyltransferase